MIKKMSYEQFNGWSIRDRILLFQVIMNNRWIIQEVKDLCVKYDTLLHKTQGSEKIYTDWAKLNEHTIHVWDLWKSDYYSADFLSQELFDLLDTQRQITYDIHKKKYDNNYQRIAIYWCKIVLNHDDVLIVGPLWHNNVEDRKLRHGGNDGVLLKGNEAIVFSSYRTSHHDVHEDKYADLGTNDERLMSFFEWFKQQIEEALRKGEENWTE